jgi:DEAD/DEAH box helicase domain-containing protein
MVHSGAIYLHDGTEFHVDSLDLNNNIAHLSGFSGTYRTEPIKSERITVEEVTKSIDMEYCKLNYGSIDIMTQVIGYKKIDLISREILGIESISMPSTDLNTCGFWVILHQRCIQKLKDENKWQGQINDYGPDWGTIRERILERDSFTCKVCGNKGKTISLHVHHKIPFKSFENIDLANSLDNLITLCPECHKLAEINVRIRNCLSGLRYVFSNLAPLLVLCDNRDLDSYSDPHAQFENLSPVVLIHDLVPGGIGLSNSLFDQFEVMIQKCFELVSTCQCESGCPSCVGPGSEYGESGKSETLFLLQLLMSQYGRY